MALLWSLVKFRCRGGLHAFDAAKVQVRRACQLLVRASDAKCQKQRAFAAKGGVCTHYVLQADRSTGSSVFAAGHCHSCRLIRRGEIDTKKADDDEKKERKKRRRVMTAMVARATILELWLPVLQQLG